MPFYLFEFYALIVIVMLMIAYAGFEGTMRVFVYIELQIKYAYIKFIMWRMGRKLKRQLDIDTEKFLKEYDVKRKNNED
jgi:hypothetical protein